MIALPPPSWEVFNDMNPAKFAEVLKKIAGQVDLGMHRKTPRGPKKPPTKRSSYKNGGHVSTHKLLTEDDP
ncbi:MAG: hypothetical protein ACRC1K_04050, partial [Planctomycetia bacterium]